MSIGFKKIVNILEKAQRDIERVEKQEKKAIEADVQEHLDALMAASRYDDLQQSIRSVPNYSDSSEQNFVTNQSISDLDSENISIGDFHGLAAASLDHPGVECLEMEYTGIDIGYDEYEAMTQVYRNGRADIEEPVLEIDEEGEKVNYKLTSNVVIDTSVLHEVAEDGEVFDPGYPEQAEFSISFSGDREDVREVLITENILTDHSMKKLDILKPRVEYSKDFITKEEYEKKPLELN